MRYLPIAIVVAHVLLVSCSDDEIPDLPINIEFDNPVEVQIVGYEEDAMEPFISPDNQYLFFNNLNDGVNTKLHYASRVNNSTFNYEGELNGANQTIAPYLDAVADIDGLNNFYWTSSRDYPAEFDNLHYGKFNGESIVDIGRVRGDFNIYEPGWLIMDHGISPDGQLLYFNNARFAGSDCQGPCETRIGVAEKVNDSTFNTVPDSENIMKEINDSNFRYYAPNITEDNLEFYYTRIPQEDIVGTSLSEICVAVRNSPSSPFSPPKVLFSSQILDGIIEAPSLTIDKQIMYYHKKINDVHKIMMRTRK